MANEITKDKKAKEFEAQNPTPPISIEEWRPYIEKLTKEIEASKRDQVTILGVFASFITFVSVDFQLLKSVSSVGDYFALTFLLLASMLLFVFGLKYLLVDDVVKYYYKKPLAVIIAIAVCFSISFYSIPRVVNYYFTSNRSM
jgi:hypothetical protein